MVKKPMAQTMVSPAGVRVIERMKYLFYSLTKTLIDVGNSIIQENSFRQPLNRADIFISLAENSIILPSIVPNVKKAAIALPQVINIGYSETLELVSLSIIDLHQCLDSFAVYYSLKHKDI